MYMLWTQRIILSLKKKEKKNSA